MTAMQDPAQLHAFDVAAILVVLVAALSYINHRLFRMPPAIGLTVMGALASLAMVGVDWAAGGLGLLAAVQGFVGQVDFYDTLMNGMLSFLLFAGALHVDLETLWKEKWAVGVMATLGVISSTALIGFVLFFIAGLLGLALPLAWCLVFGALISPTDPVAVLGLLRAAKVPPALEAKVVGESLFNDGVGVVVFAILLSFAIFGGDFSFAQAGLLFVTEAGGGIALGLVGGWIAYLLLKSVDEANLEIFITLALVMGGYALAHQFHVAGPVAMAVAGLFIGNRGKRLAMSEKTRDRLGHFWDLIDELLNGVLFLMIGLEVVALSHDPLLFTLGVIAILVALGARALVVALALSVFRPFREFTKGAWWILTWGGLRGGISIALALSLPPGELREAILTVTYVVVIFSVIVQGGTVARLARRVVVAEEVRPEGRPH